MNYEDKYLKYKSKYTNLKNDMNGGINIFKQKNKIESNISDNVKKLLSLEIFLNNSAILLGYNPLCVTNEE